MTQAATRRSNDVADFRARLIDDAGAADARAEAGNLFAAMNASLWFDRLVAGPAHENGTSPEPTATPELPSRV